MYLVAAANVENLAVEEEVAMEIAENAVEPRPDWEEAGLAAKEAVKTPLQQL